MIAFEDRVFDAFFFEADFCFLLLWTAASVAVFSPIVIFYRFL